MLENTRQFSKIKHSTERNPEAIIRFREYEIISFAKLKTRTIHTKFACTENSHHYLNRMEITIFLQNFWYTLQSKMVEKTKCL